MIFYAQSPALFTCASVFAHWHMPLSVGISQKFRVCFFSSIFWRLSPARAPMHANPEKSCNLTLQVKVLGDSAMTLVDKKPHGVWKKVTASWPLSPDSPSPHFPLLLLHLLIVCIWHVFLQFLSHFQFPTSHPASLSAYSGFAPVVFGLPFCLLPFLTPFSSRCSSSSSSPSAFTDASAMHTYLYTVPQCFCNGVNA